jgi:pimeloyl-ACP methyl ester carboxylesterase
LFVIGCMMILGGALLAQRIQTVGGIHVEDVRFRGKSGAVMSALLYVPPNATMQTPAPGVLAVHGYINSRETQSGFAIEFARRGYVVLALDQTGHGYSAPPAFAHGFGGPDGLAYLRSLPYVDKDNIGLEGHSMGGWTVLAAAAAAPDDYRAIVLEGSSTGKPFAREGDPGWPRNLAVVFSRYDEFSKTMWGVDRAQDVETSVKLQKLFGAAERIRVGHTYGAIADGDARQLYTPLTTHPGDHLSTAAVGDAADWFRRTLAGGTPRLANDQIWYWKEIGTGVAFAGFVVLLLGAFDLLLGLPFFAGLRAAPAPARQTRDGGWWVALILSAALPALTYFPFFKLAGGIAPASPFLPQAITNQIAFWALVNGLIALAIGIALRGPKANFTTRWAASTAIAVLTIAIGYAALIIVDRAFKVDFRFWVVALKLMSAAQWKMFLIYLPAFLVAFLLLQRALVAGLAVRDEGWFPTYAAMKVGACGGFAVLLALEYGALFARGALLTPDEPLNTIVAIQFLPLLAITGIIAAFTYRRTNSYLPGALVCAFFLTWCIVAGQATQAAV